MTVDTTLVNSMYPLDYFGLANVTRIKYPDQSWWSSRQRFASVDPNNPTSYLAIENGGQHTSEYLEIDLGRLREINYLNFQVMRAPIDISIEYDAVSGDDGTHNWIRVSKVPDMPFDNVIHFDANARNAWFNAQFYFGDANDNQVSSRFLRLRFKRRPHPWPTDKSNPFRWPISVKSLRSARYIATLKDTVGPLINTGAGDTQIALDINPQKESYEIRQKFQMPSDYMRGDVSPALMGFSFEALITATNTEDGFSANPVTLDDVAWKWSLLDATNPAQSVQLLTGHVNGALNNDRTWIDVFFDPAEPLNPDPAKTYEIRLRSLNTDASDAVYVVTYSVTSPMPGGFQATQIHAGGTTQTLTSQCLSLRVWADIADTGTDVLGNTYRYATRRDDAANVYNNSKIGWMCEPQPSPEAVEALYFDVRVPDPTNVNLNIASIIDAFQASPRTQGVRMHFYYTDHGMQNDRPHTRDDWDNMIWTPVNVTYTLRGNQIIELPQSIRASFIKLEFSRLQPYPYRLPEYPKLPNREYHRYPTWIEEQFSNTELKRTVSDWFIKNLTPRRRKIIKDLADPVLEFQFKEREFLAALSTGDLSKRFANSQFVDIADKALIDPITGSKLFVDDGALYKNSLTANVDRSSVLGGLVADRFDPTVPNTVIEAVVNKNSSLTPHVSTSNDRISESFAFLASTPMWFNRKCRHHYKIERAGFNKQAFFVGINQAQFFRKDYTTRRDDSLILDNLHDNNNLEDNTFQFDVGSAIWRALPAFQTQSQQGLTLYVTYSINPTYTDEPITFFAPPPPPGSNTSSVEDADSVTLTGTGGAAFNIVVSSQPGGQGTVYQPGTDYDISYGLDPETGATTNIVSISTLASRMVATNFTRKVDVASVVGRAVISSTEQYITGASGNQEAAVVSGVAVPSAVDTENMVDAAIVIGVADVHQGGYVDSALVIGVADQATMSNSFEQFIAHGGTNYNDAATVTGVAVPITVDSHGYIDSALVTGVMDLTAVAGSVNTTDFVDPFQNAPSTNSGTGVAMHQGTGLSDAVDTQVLFASVPNAHMQSIWVRWSSLQPTGPADFSGFASTTSNGNTIDNSFDHAKANGYKIIIRVSCGCDAPAWLYNTGVVGTPAVTQLKTIATDSNLGPISVPLPWDAKLLTYYQGMLDLLAAKFDPAAASGLTAGGTRRSDYGHFIAVSMPTEVGTEMAMGYGPGASYLPASPATLFGPGAATVTGPITETDLTIKLQGTVTSYVAPMLLKIDSELMYCSAFNSGTKVATVVRGFSGSAVAGHNQATAVTYLDQTASGAWPITQGTTGSYFGTTGIFEMQTLNKSQWEGGGRTLSANQANLKAAWYSAITATSTHFSTPSGIPCCVAIGPLFIDKYAAAKEIGGATGSKTVWFMTTNLQPGRIVNATQISAEVAAGNAGAALNDPTRYDTSGTLWPTYYEAWSPVVVDAMNTAAAAGAVIGFQTAGNTVWSTFNTPYAGLTHAFRISLEEALSVFDPLFIELNTTLATTNDPAVAPSTDTTYFYLFGV